MDAQPTQEQRKSDPAAASQANSFDLQLSALQDVTISPFVSRWGYQSDLGRNGWGTYYPGHKESCIQFASSSRRPLEIFLVMPYNGGAPPALRLLGFQTAKDVIDLVAQRLVCGEGQDGITITARSGVEQDTRAAALLQLHLRHTLETERAELDLWHKNRELCYCEVVTTVMDANIDASASVEARNNAEHAKKMAGINERFAAALREFAETQLPK